MRIKPLALILAGALALPSAAIAADAAPVSDKPLATVNGVAVPAIYAEVIGQSRAAQGQAAPGNEGMREALINLEILSQEAVKKGLDRPANVRAILEIQRKESLVKLLQEDFVKNTKISDEAIKAEYNKAQAQAGSTEYHARHILVASEDDAKVVIARLDKKVKFEDLAKKWSRDSSKAQGGDLGWQSPANLVPEFSGAMVKLKPGEYTKTPVQSRFGWHVIRLDETRKLAFPAYDQVKDQIAGQLLQLAYRKYATELRAAAKVD